MSQTVLRRQNWTCVACVEYGPEAARILDLPHAILSRYSVIVRYCQYDETIAGFL
jgi:hypothetical protein